MSASEADMLPTHPRPWLLRLSYLDSDGLGALLRDTQRVLLGEIHYGRPLRALTAVDHPHAIVGMPQLGTKSLVEVWTSDLPVTYRHEGDLTIACNSEILFGCITHSGNGVDDFEHAIRDSYAHIISILQTEGYPHLLRMWNYFPGIGDVIGGLDRYQVFCRGRFQALQTRYGMFEGRLPAASAVGSIDGDTVIYFIAGRQPGRHRENPRQISAYRYPPQYGPRSPSFARATFKRCDGGRGCLYISGTASIVGHESMHPNDPAEQLEETLRNLRTLIDGARAEERAKFHGLDSVSHLKAYIRDPAHFGLISRRIGQLLRPQVPVLYLRADVCRPDLLLEIEAVVKEES